MEVSLTNAFGRAVTNERDRRPGLKALELQKARTPGKH